MCRRPASVTWVLLAIGIGIPDRLTAQHPDLSARGQPVPLSIGSPAGARVYKPGRWAPVGIEVANPTDEAQVVTATFYFPLVPDVQYSRRVYVPAHTRRLATCLVQTPLLESRDAIAQQQYRKTFDLHAIVTAGEDSSQVLPGITGELTRNSFLVKHLEHISSAMFPDPAGVPETSYPSPYDAVIAMRLVVGLSRRVGEFMRPVFPDSLHALDALQHIVLHNNEAFRDAATVAALRAWVARGGRLWIMLDEVDEANVQWLLGERLTPTIVDRTELTHFQLRSMLDSESVDEQTHERPVVFLRVCVEDAQVTHTIDGWPAAFVQHHGLGRILFTTLGAAGWVRRARPFEINPLDPDRQAVYLARPPLQELGTWLFAPEETLPWESTTWRPYLQQRIGYRIVNRRWVLGLLTLYVFGLVGISWVGYRSGRAYVLAVLLPAWMVVASVPLIALAWGAQREVPHTIAEAHHVVVPQDGTTAYVRGAIAVYQNVPRDVPVEASTGAVFQPDGDGMEGSLRQLVFDDFHRWRWDHLRLPAGVRLGEIQSAVELVHPLRVHATFGPNGIEGTIEGLPVVPITDPLIVMPNGGALALHVDDRGSFWAGPADALPAGRYVAGTFLLDEQRRRQWLWEQARELRVHTRFPREPTLVFWAPPIAHGVQFGEQYQRQATALYQTRFRLHRPTSGTSVTIPPTFLHLLPAAGPTGRGIATAYDPRRATWLPLSVASDVWLRVELPTPLLPFSVRRAAVDMQILAPNRPVELLLRQQSQVRTVERWESPAGRIRCELTDQDWLEIDHQGAVWLGLRVGDPIKRTSQDPQWQVQSLLVTIEGVVE